MFKIKKWWNNFRQDLFFNITMTIMCSILYVATIMMGILAIKELIDKLC